MVDWGYWHGGLHIGASSFPASVLNQDTPEKSVPLQFMMDGDTLAVLQQKSFLLDRQPEPFALVQRLEEGKPAGALFWVAMRPEYLEPDGECYLCLPDWMHNALNRGALD